MKIRKGFVSNSSSSSFICAVSGEMEAGWDLSLSDCSMVQCENEHTFFEHYITFEDFSFSEDRDTLADIIMEEYKKNPDMFDYSNSWHSDMKPLSDTLKLGKKNIDWDSFINMLRYGIPKCWCPICTMVNISVQDLQEYVLRKYYDGDKDKVIEEIKQRFTEYAELDKFITTKRNHHV